MSYDPSENPTMISGRFIAHFYHDCGCLARLNTVTFKADFFKGSFPELCVSHEVPKGYVWKSEEDALKATIK